MRLLPGFPALIAGALGVALLFPGCSQKQLYEAVQQNQQQRCLTVPEGARDDCLAQSSTTYDEYQEILEDADEVQSPDSTDGM